jgi:hypothetical protein
MKFAKKPAMKFAKKPAMKFAKKPGQVSYRSDSYLTL